MRKRVKAFAGLVGACAGWLILSTGSHAAVEVLPETILTVDGQAITDRQSLVRNPTVQEILSAFDRAEAALQKEQLDELLRFYAKAYNYHGMKRSELPRVWGEVFAHYRGLSSTHVFSEIKIIREGNMLRAEIACTGGLYGTEITGGPKLTLDSWVREVHHLVFEDGAWRFLGNAGSVPHDIPVTSIPHHPIF